MRGDVEPLEATHDPEYQRVPVEELLVVEPDHVVIVDVVPEMLVSHVLVGAVGCAAQPAHRPAEGGIVPAAFEDEIVAAFVNQVGGDGHCVREKQCCRRIDDPGIGKQAREPRNIPCDGVQQRAAVHQQARRFPKQRNDRWHGLLTRTDFVDFSCTLSRIVLLA